MSLVPVPKEKPSNSWHSVGFPFPVPAGDVKSVSWPTYNSTFDEGRVYIEDEISIKEVFERGCFGKGSLSRGEPMFQKTREIYSSSTYSFQDIVELRPYPNDNNGFSTEDSVIACATERVFSVEKTNDEPLIVNDIDSESVCNETETDPQSALLKESLELMLEEAFFLKYSFDCLDVREIGSSNSLSCLELWDLFCKADPRFWKRYTAYHYYRSKGWVVKSGLIFGGDFALYKDGPSNYHSTFVVLVKGSEDEEVSWVQLSALIRVAEKMSKTVIICEVCKKESSSGFLLDDLKEIQVRELMLKRWVPAKQRLEKQEKDEEEEDT